MPSFYGINLNQNVVLEQIGYAGTTGTPWTRLFKISTGGIIITALGFVPGYYVTVLTIEYLGRKWIQIQGFLMAALMCKRKQEFDCGDFNIVFSFKWQSLRANSTISNRLLSSFYSPYCSFSSTLVQTREPPYLFAERSDSPHI